FFTQRDSFSQSSSEALTHSTQSPNRLVYVIRVTTISTLSRPDAFREITITVNVGMYSIMIAVTSWTKTDLRTCGLTASVQRAEKDDQPQLRSAVGGLEVASQWWFTSGT
ncbi:hypothetical protein EG68_06997, partial [Paragonimus skrjabini miyazakii]